MPELNRIETNDQGYLSALSGRDVIPPARNTTHSEIDVFNHPWGASQITEPSRFKYSIHFNADTPDWIPNVVENLNKFLSYEENWDSYGAERIEFDSTIFILEMLRELVDMDIPEPSVVPASDGCIQMEWHIKDTNFEIKMMPNRDTEYSFDDVRDDFEDKEDVFIFNRTQLPGDFIDCINDFLTCVSTR